MPDILKSILIWSALVAVLALALGHGKPANVVALFVVSGLAVGSLYALGGIGIVVLYRATGVLNLAAGAIGAVSVMAAWQLVAWGVVAPVAWVLGLALGPLLATLYGRSIAARMAWREPVVKAVASIGFAFVLLGLLSFVFSDDPRKFELPTDKAAVMILGMRITVTRLMAMGLAVALVIGITLALDNSRVGLQMRALADNRRISSLIGIPIVQVETLAWALSGLIFGLTGLFFGNLVRLEPAVITFMVIPCVAAAIAGRLQSLPDVLIAGLAMGAIESLLTLSDTLKSIRPVAPFVIAALVLMLMNRSRRLTFSGED